MTKSRRANSTLNGTYLLIGTNKARDTRPVPKIKRRERTEGTKLISQPHTKKNLWITQRFLLTLSRISYIMLTKKSP